MLLSFSLLLCLLCLVLRVFRVFGFVCVTYAAHHATKQSQIHGKHPESGSANIRRRKIKATYSTNDNETHG
jgi:hypothetical protein